MSNIRRRKYCDCIGKNVIAVKTLESSKNLNPKVQIQLMRYLIFQGGINQYHLNILKTKVQ